MASSASNSDVQYVAYLKAKFNLADGDLLRVISLSQRPSSSQELSGAPEGGYIEDIVEYEEEKVEVGAMMDSSAYEDVEMVDDESYEEEVVEYIDNSWSENNQTPSPAPVPIPLPAPEPNSSPTPDPVSQALVLVEDAPHDEIEEYEQAKLEEEAPPVKTPETAAESSRKYMASVIEPTDVITSNDEANALAVIPQQEDSNAQAMVPYKSQPPEQAPPTDEELAIVPSRPTDIVPSKPSGNEEKEKEKEKEEKSSTTMYLLVIVFLLIAIVVILILIFVTGTIPKFWEDDSGPAIMEPYVPGNCDFSGQAQPNVVSQCECNQQVTVIDPWTQQQYDRLSTEFIVPTIYPSWDHPIESCETSNKALLWLATGPVITDQATLTNRYIMAFFYYSTIGQSWINQAGWMSEQDVCTWLGVTCSGSDIQQMQLPSNFLAGQIPTELKILTLLDTLAFDNNNIGNTLPSEVFALPNLRTLTLGTNQLYGSIPGEIGQALQLENLRLSGNSFSGAVPTQLNLLTRLLSLSLENNAMLTGRIATEYGQFTNLQSLTLSGTSIRARIPTEYGALTNLQELNLAYTLVGGDIPADLARLTGLRIVDFTGSRFRQTIPSFLGSLTNLLTLLLGNNDLSGTVPPQLGSLTQLQTLDLSSNRLAGLIPLELGNLISLSRFTIQGNPFLSGRIPAEVCLLRGGSMQSFVADCPARQFGVICPLTTCCTECFELNVVDAVVDDPFV